MALVSTAVTVGTSVTVVSPATAGTYDYKRYVYLQTGTGGALAYAGASDVSASSGILLSETNNAVFELKSDDVLYAITDTAGAVVKVLEVK